jgi:hypothetical protein
MSFNLVLNSSNNVGSNANTFQYNFIGGNFQVHEGMEICLAQATIPYSFYNITTSQTVTINWTVGATVNTYSWIIAPGFYSVSDLNLALQLFCVNNGLYLVSGSSNVYYLSLYTNTALYKNQLIAELVPTSLPSGYTQPSGFVGYPTVTVTPQIVLSSSSSQINSILGFATGTFPSVNTASTSVLSTLVPVGSAVNSLLMTCNLVSNPVTMPSNILSGIPIDSTFGSNINYNPSYEQWVKITPGKYSSLTIQLTDQNYNPLTALDTNVLIVLNIRRGNPNGSTK